ncbi:hypothetical protein RRG08_061143 [Elysia crispata]|uniref:Uncharacterized protein n=1 Tax=Elysia crispata TaxID=231223 RepID=A0AAE1CEJ6_9GAST|nr:hypothetical protein RRG08_061143 [Elysia crispata]
MIRNGILMTLECLAVTKGPHRIYPVMNVQLNGPLIDTRSLIKRVEPLLLRITHISVFDTHTLESTRACRVTVFHVTTGSMSC